MALPPEAVEVKSGREFHFTPADFTAICRLIHSHTGISLAPSKTELVYGRLSRRIRKLNLPSFAAYVDYVEREPDEVQRFVNSLTTNLTSFFREAHHFGELKRFLERRERAQAPRIWCAASSTGEEPYSIAMTLFETYRVIPPALMFVATDVDTEVLARAHNGVYSIEQLDKVSEERRYRFFLRGTGVNAGKARVAKALRDLVSFRQLNLSADSWRLPAQEFDVVFARNVLIYFDRPTQLRILKRFHSVIKPNGLLFTGHSEILHGVARLFVPVGKTVYRREETTE